MNAQFFINREENIKKAIERADALYLRYVQLLPNWPYSWDFNLLHDLKYRLEARLWDNWTEYHSWHWDTYGWNAY